MAKKAKFKEGKYICTKGCYHNSILFRLNDPAVFTKDNPPPLTREGEVNHFRLVKEDEVITVDLGNVNDNPETGSISVDDLSSENENDNNDLDLTGDVS